MSSPVRKFLIVMQMLTTFLSALLRNAYLLVLCVCVLPIAGVWGGHLHWSLDLASQFLLPTVVVCCLVAILAGLSRHSWIGVSALVLAVIASAEAGPWMTSPAKAPANAPVFSVLFLNAWVRNEHPEAVAELIRTRNADLVVMVEATPRLRAALQAVIQTYPYHTDCVDTPRCATLILSRARLLPGDITTDDVSTMSVRADLAGCLMPVTAVHLTRPFPFASAGDQVRQAMLVSAMVASKPGAQLVVGDFNAAPWSHVMQIIRRGGQLDILTGAGGTWPIVLPKQVRIPIDHMLAGKGLRFVSREVPASVGSDHAPVFARIAITDPSMCDAR